jgi:hypothetical protein
MVVSTTALTLSLGVVTPESHAGATGTSSVVCSIFNVRYEKVRECSPSGGRPYRYATAPSSVLGPWASSGGTLTWAGGGTTTISSSTFTSTAGTSCPQSTLYKKADGAQTESASVTGASAVGPGIPAVGDAVAATFCYYYQLQNHFEVLKAIQEPGSTVGL